MINLKEYIKEGLFDDLDKREEVGGLNAATEDIKKEIIDWFKNNVRPIRENKLKFDFDTTPITIYYDGDIEFKTHITSLTNGIFQWREVGGSFKCFNCFSLKSLEGAPKYVGCVFNCFNCQSLTSLKGAPEKVDGGFSCEKCVSLKSLEGAPKEVRGSFNCNSCHKLTNLEGAPEKVGWNFYCRECSSLKSLKGAPKKVDGCFDCKHCGTQFNEEDVRKVSDVKEYIYC